MNIAMILPLLQMLPGLVDGGMKIVQALRDDPGTPADVQAELEEISKRLDAIVEKVKNVRLPD